jgi:hypothetical protein
MLHEEKTILQLSLALLQLQSRHDAAGIDAVLDDDAEAFDAAGRRCDKSRLRQYLLGAAAAQQQLSEVRITVLGDAAYETGLLCSPAARCQCYSRLWLRCGSTWRLRGMQLTPRAEP